VVYYRGTSRVASMLPPREPMRTTLLVLRLTFLGLALLPLATSTALAADQNAIAACQLAAVADDSGAQDLATLRALVQQMSSTAAQSAEPDVRRSATMLGRAARRPNPVTIHAALRSFDDTCRRIGVTAATSEAVPLAEFDRQLKSMLERTGEGGASCSTQHVEGGWVAVCE